MSHTVAFGRRVVVSGAMVLPVFMAQGVFAESGSVIPTSGESVVLQSGESGKVIEKVRAGAAGVLTELFVKPGDVVKKGQILGYLDLDSTKFQMDLAKAALDSKANVEAAKGQAEAWAATRRETEDAARKRKAEKTRLEWALGMEQMFRGTYEAQVDLEKTQAIQYEYWKDQYAKRFFHAPVDGVVTEVLSDIGKTVTIASHVFTVRNDRVISIPVSISEQVAQATAPGDSVAIRPVGVKSTAHAIVESVKGNPLDAAHKTARLVVPVEEFPLAVRSKVLGVKFEVLFPLTQ